jgi:hypothetical protein
MIRPKPWKKSSNCVSGTSLPLFVALLFRAVPLKHTRAVRYKVATLFPSYDGNAACVKPPKRLIKRGAHMSDETICSLFKLIEACNHGSQIFLGGAMNIAEPALQELALGIGRRLVRFESELQNAIFQVGGPELPAWPSEPVPGDLNGLFVCGKISLALILFYYQQALKTNQLDGICTMIKRQYSDMQQAYERLVSLHQAA